MAAVELTVEVSGSGPTRERAFAAAMAQVQARVRDRVAGVPIRIEPRDIALVRATEERRTERFLGLFLPRTRSDFALVVSVTVHVTAFRLDDVEFAVSDEHLSPIQRLLHLR
ncbi:DUF4312 family protein [Nocardiopsis sediminis]|uniref:DUF4312 family protein n=1 Tax=Nocardiopsis sediminis TaxID=1778267 RepID=A0ABV8FZJ4_9ACTN